MLGLELIISCRLSVNCCLVWLLVNDRKSRQLDVPQKARPHAVKLLLRYLSEAPATLVTSVLL